MTWISAPDEFEPVSELTPEHEGLIDNMLFPSTSFYEDTLPPLVEAVYLAWSEKGYRSIQCAGAVRKLCKAWGEAMG